MHLFPTIARHDAVYASLFKCSATRVRDLPNLQARRWEVSAGGRGVARSHQLAEDGTAWWFGKERQADALAHALHAADLYIAQCN